MDPQLRNKLKEFRDDEITPLLKEMEETELKMYKESIIQRFVNPYLKDRLSRICSESSAKIPKFVLPSIKEQLVNDGSIKIGTLIIAAWCYYLERADTPGYNYPIKDAMIYVLRQKTIDAASADPLAFLKIESIFDDLVHSNRFVDNYLTSINSLRDHVIEHVIREVNKSFQNQSGNRS